jgi:GT2 family glycosyltransferase
MTIEQRTEPADVSVVICAYDDARWDDLQAALDSVERQTAEAREAIVVIDHNERLLSRAHEQLSGARVVENTGRRGLAGARNSGIAAAHGSIVAFLDDDAVATREWLRLLVDKYEDPHVAGVGGRADPVWVRGRPAWFPEEFDWVVGCTHAGHLAQGESVRNLIGCNMSFRRDVLEAVGGFRLGYGGDETELCIRVRQRWPEKRLLYVPAARVYHRVPTSRARVRYFLWRCYVEGRAKARVSRLVGSQDGLATERHYVRRVLPRAARDGLLAFASGRDRAGLARASMILAGLTATSVAYAFGRLSPDGRA